MDAPVAEVAPPDSVVDAGAPGGDAAAEPAVRTFASAGARLAWADDEEDEPMTEERQRQFDEIVGKYKSRGERFGTDAATDHVPKKSPSLLDAPLGGGKQPRLSRLELMEKRRLQQGTTGFATGFDVMSPEEQRKRAERAARYGASLEGGSKAADAGEVGGSPAGALVVDVLEPRRDALGDAVVRHECVYVYGVDHLSTKECMAYFGDYAPVFVEWINDSSCNVVFADAFTAKRAMYGKGVPETSAPATEAPATGAPDAAAEAPMVEGDAAPVVPRAPEEDGDAVMTTGGSAPHPECFFFKGADFVKPSGVRVPLTFRLATTDDVKPDGKTASRYLWCGGKRPGPPPKRGNTSGRKRRRRDEDGGDEEGLVEAEVVPDIDLREALKRRREQAGAEAGAMETGEEGDKAEGAVEAPATVEAVPLVLPPGDLRAKLAAAAAEVVEAEVVDGPTPVDAK